MSAASWSGLGSANRLHGNNLTRFVTIPHAAPQVRADVALPEWSQALLESRTAYPSRVFGAGERERVLISGFNNSKIGARVTKGAWAGFPIYTLSLEERATCPSSCTLLRECYGNGMPLAVRFRHDASLIRALDHELREMGRAHPRGFVVRLHVLGDFPDLDYVDAWAEWMRDIPALRVWGYTAHRPDSALGQRVVAVNAEWPGRWVFRFSVPYGADAAPGQATTVWAETARQNRQDDIACPAETGKTLACATCALCWSPAAIGKRIVFMGHGRKRHGWQRPSRARRPLEDRLSDIAADAEALRVSLDEIGVLLDRYRAMSRAAHAEEVIG